MGRIKLCLGYFSSQHNLVDLRNLQPNITYDSSKNQPNLTCWCQVVWCNKKFEFSCLLSSFFINITIYTIKSNILILSKLILRIPKYIKVTYMSDIYFSRYQIKVYIFSQKKNQSIYVNVTVHTNTKKTQ